MSLKLLYESISFIIAGYIFNKFAFPIISNYIINYKKSIINNISELEDMIHQKNDLSSQLAVKLKNIQNDINILKDDINIKLNSHKLKVENTYNKMLNKNNNLFAEKLDILHEQYKKEIINQSALIVKSKCAKLIKSNNIYPRNMLNKLNNINLKNFINK